MKTKILLGIGLCAIVTLSFTLVGLNNKPASTPQIKASNDAPAGGFIMEDKM